MRPALVIALGGTGTNMAFKLRRRLFMEFGFWDLDRVRYMYVDTDAANNEARTACPSQWYPLQASRQTIDDAAQADSETARNLHIGDWLEPGLRDELTNQSFNQGVRGVRAYGRLNLLAANGLERVIEAIDREIQGLRRIAAGEVVYIYVLSSAGGGTGSGVFLDMGYLARWRGASLNLESGELACEGIAAIAVPTLVSAPAHSANSAALLSELDHFSSSQNVFRAWYDGVGLHETPLGHGVAREAPYDQIFLVSPTQGSRVLDTTPAKAMGILEQRVADFVFLRLIGPNEADGDDQGRLNMGEIDARIADMSVNYRQIPTDAEGYPNRFITFGEGLLHFPVGLCERLGHATAVVKFSDSWLKKDGKEENQFIDLSSAQLKALFDRDLAELCATLGLRTLDARGEKRISENDAVFSRLVRPVGDNVYKLDQALADGFRSGKEKLDQLFDRVANPGIPITPAVPGYISRTVAKNLEALMDASGSADSSIFTATKSKLLDIAFDGARGPRYALQLLRSMASEMELEERVIGKCLESGLIEGAGEADERADAARRDPLLFWRWKDESARRELETGGASLADYADSRFEHCVIEAKRMLLSTVRQELLLAVSSEHASVNLQKRLERLVEYICDWTRVHADSRQELQRMVSDLPQGCIWPDKAIVRKWNVLIPSIRPQDALMELREQLLHEAFLKDLPRGPDGRESFALFSAVERAIEDGLARTDVSAKDSIRRDSVVRLLTEEDAMGLEEGASHLVDDGEPLLSLRISDPAYSRLKFLQPTFRWFFAARSDLDPGSCSDLRLMVDELGNNQQIDPKHRGYLQLEQGSVAAVVGIRAAFPSEIINMYDPPSRLNMLGYGDDAQLQAWPYTQTGIKLPVPNDDLDKATGLMLLAQSLLWHGNKSQELPRITRPRSDGHELWYSGRYSQPTVVPFPNASLEAAAAELARNPEAIASLNRGFMFMRQDANNKGGYQAEINKHVKALSDLCTEEARNIEARGRGVYKGFGLSVTYADALEKLCSAALNELDIDSQEWGELKEYAHPWATYINEIHMWRCNKCDHDQGEKKPDPNGRCANVQCRYPY